jgi:hypothetical protein
MEATTAPPLARASAMAMTVPKRRRDMVSSGVLLVLDRAFACRCQPTDDGRIDDEHMDG